MLAFYSWQHKHMFDDGTYYYHVNIEADTSHTHTNIVSTDTK